jgi:molybdopterin-biosynthesis enzyme MoeA-like protein
LDTKYAGLHHANPYVERSVLVFGLPESRVTPLMEAIEREFAGVRVFSLPSVGDIARGAVYERAHIDLGVKGEPDAANAAFVRLREGVTALGGEIVENEPSGTN